MYFMCIPFVYHCATSTKHINPELRKTCIWGVFFAKQAQLHHSWHFSICAFSSEISECMFLGKERKYLGEKPTYPSIRTKRRVFRSSEHKRR